MSTKLEIENALKRASEDPLTFFGSDPDEVLRQWKIATHPDKWPDCADEAKHWFTQFTDYRLAAANVQRIGQYRVKRKLATGDLCEILIATEGLTAADVLIKKPVVKATSLMKNEWTAIEKIRSNASEQAKHLFPVPLHRLNNVSVFAFDPNLETLDSIMQRYPEGVGGRHIGWIFKRIMLALTWAHAAEIVHGAITPEHILVSKSNHGIVLCGWIHSGKPGDAIKIVPRKYKDTYPELAVKSKTLHPEMDVAMAAAIARKACGDDTPMQIRAYLSAISNTNCVSGVGTWNLHQEFDAVLKRVYGAPKFVELV